MNDVTSLVTEGDLGKALQEAALLAHVKISVWDGMRSDRTLLEEVKTRHGAKGDVGKMIKNMLAGADAPLKLLRGAYHAVRLRHYELTLPWVSDANANRLTGPRLLPHPLFSRYLGEVGTLRRNAETELDNFLPMYPDLVTKARDNLGGMADTDYPSVEDVRSRFRIYQDFEPIPDGTNFKGLPGNMLERLSKHLNDRQTRQKDAATAAMWAEAKDRIEHLVNRLDGEDIRFKEASVRAVRELVTLLPGWNISGDARALEVAQDIDAMLSGIEASDLRKDANIRQSTVAEARKITDKLSKWGL